MESEKKDSIVELAANLAMRAGEFEEVLILCTKKDGGGCSMDNGIDVKQAVWMCSKFISWVLTHT